MATLGEIGGGHETVGDWGPTTSEDTATGGVSTVLGGNLGRAVEGALGGLFGKSKERPRKGADDCAQRPARAGSR